MTEKMLVKRKSRPPMKNPTMTLAKMTIVVRRIVSDFDGQTTFLSSSLTSTKNLAMLKLVKLTAFFIKNAPSIKG